MSIRLRIIIYFTVLIIMSGIITTWLVTGQLVERMRASLLHKGGQLVLDLAHSSIDDILSEDIFALTKRINEIKSIDEDILYIFLINKYGKIVAHTFTSGFPVDLISSNRVDEGERYHTTFLDTEEGIVYDFAAPIIEGKAGVARIGLVTKNQQRTITGVRNNIVGSTIAILFIGILGIVFLAFTITKPLKELTETAHKICKEEFGKDIAVMNISEIENLHNAFNLSVDSMRSHIKQLQESEQKIKFLNEYNENLLNKMGDAICVINKEYKIEFVNETLRREYGDINGMDCRETFGEKVRPCSRCPASQVIKSDKSTLINYQTEDGRSLDILFFPLHNADGSISVIARATDVTEQVQLQNLVKQSEKMAAIGHMAASLAHEINNPVAGLENAIQLIKKRLSGQEKFIQYIDLMKDAIDKIGNTVRQLLDFARPIKMKKIDIDLNKICEHVITHLDYRINKKSIRVVTDIDQTLPKVLGDSDQIEQVISNLILNALYAMNNSGELRITTYLNHEREGEFACIDISDTGIGISKEKIHSIFEPYVSTKDFGHGTGLGLTISQNIINEHKGFIKVKSTEGKGSVFTIQLPINNT